jgi:hypothetical protein
MLIGLITGALVATVTAGALPAAAAQVLSGALTHTSSKTPSQQPHKSSKATPARRASTVSNRPAAGTPQLSAAGGTSQQVRQIVQCGDRMYAVGKFTRISQGGRVYDRNNAFSFLAKAPYTVTSWAPGANGEVDTVAFAAGDCSSAYLGGSFTSVHGTHATNIAKVDTTTGAVGAGFARAANGSVETLAVHAGHVLAGGYFTTINGSHRRYYVSLDSATGQDDGYLRLAIHGSYQFPGAAPNHTRVYNQQLSPAGGRLLAEGDFTSAGDQHREQVFMLSLGQTRGTVTAWTSDDFSENCHTTEPYYVRSAAWAPNSKTVYVATTGFTPADDPGFGPRSGICDAAVAYPARNQTVSRRWVNYTGCDSLFAAAADSATVYVAGHERWADNSLGCNRPGRGAVSAQGVGGLSPRNGALVFAPTRSRGLGADDLLVTTKGLWIASDNTGGSSQCGGRGGHAGICFLPYRKGGKSGPVPPVPGPPVPPRPGPPVFGPPGGITRHPPRWHVPVFPIG